MSIKVSSDINGEEVLESGSVILANDEVFSLSLEDGNDKVKIEFLFLVGPGLGPKTKTELRAPDTLRFIMEDWAHTGFEKMRVGDLNDKPVYLLITSQPLAHTHVLHYVVLTGPH